jgi:phosphoribosylamine--glycine ligase
MVAYAKENSVDLVVVAPDDPLALGMVDALEEAGIRAFGPRKNAAVIEASKVFSKKMMQKYGIPTAEYQVFTEPKKAVEYIRSHGTRPSSSWRTAGARDGAAFVGAGSRAFRRRRGQGYDARQEVRRKAVPEFVSRGVFSRPVVSCSLYGGKSIVPCPPPQDHSAFLSLRRDPTPAVWALSVPARIIRKISPTSAWTLYFSRR